jgi:acyl-CoA thioesterase-1
LTLRWLLYGAPLLLVQLAVGCSPAETGRESAQAAAQAADGVTDVQQQAIDDSRPLVVAFGDSLFAGYNLDQGEGLVPELQRALAAKGIEAQVFNGAVSGDTSAAGLQRLDFVLDGLPRKPDLVIVGLGGNDMLRGLDPAETRKNLEAILTRLKEHEIPILLSGMLASRNMGPEYASEFDPIFPELAREFGATLYPFTLDGVIGNQQLLLPDGIHPNEEGVELIAGRMAPIVAAELR